MALAKSPLNKSVSRTFLDEVAALQNQHSNYRLKAYESLTQSLVKAVDRGEVSHETVYSVALPATLHDVGTGNDRLVLAALGFLGGLLQVVKLPLPVQISVIETLTVTLTSATDKNLSKKLMWSLANIQFDNELPLESLLSMLNAACTFLKAKPVLSLSTICESLNTIKNIGQRRPKFIITNLSAVVAAVIPWLFNDADRIRHLSFDCIDQFSTHIADQKILDASFQNELRDTYTSALTQLVAAEASDSLKIWSFLIRGFGTELHDSISLLNGLLKIEESALKSKNHEFRQLALEFWKDIIDCFALNPAVLNNSKRIKLVLVPLKSTDNRTVDFTRAKILLWWYLLQKLGPDAANRFKEVTVPLLSFCFGGDTQTKGVATSSFPSTIPLALAVLAGILSEREDFSVEVEGLTLSRSFLFLNPCDFDLEIDHFRQLSLQMLPLDAVQFGDLLKISIIQSFVARCTADTHSGSLREFVHSILALVTNQNNALMEPVFEAFVGCFSNARLLQALTADIACLVGWYAENEPLPVHPLANYLTKFFHAGITWDVAAFSTKIIDVLAEGTEKSAGNLRASEDLFTTFLTAVMSAANDSHIQRVSIADQRSILLPLTWPLQRWSSGNLLHPWSALVIAWAKEDCSILSKALNPLGSIDELAVDDSIVRLILKTIRPHFESYSGELESWIKRWTAAWVKRVGSQKERAASAGLLACQILRLVEVLSKEAAETLLQDMKSALKENIANEEVLATLQAIFGPASGVVKVTSVHNLRQDQRICKDFSQLLPKKPRGRPKSSDNFVMVPPSEKVNKRVLTEHQKEVMRSKRHSSAVPALYSDLSQSSLPEPCSLMDSQTADTTIVVASNRSTALREEDALLEPPSPMTDEQEEQLTLPVHDKENPIGTFSDSNQSPSIGELFKKDLKLRSKVSIPVSKLPLTRRSLRLNSDSSPGTVADTPEIPLAAVGRGRPCPASKKAALLMSSNTSANIVEPKANADIIPASHNGECSEKENSGNHSKCESPLALPSPPSPSTLTGSRVADDSQPEAVTTEVTVEAGPSEKAVAAESVDNAAEISSTDFLTPDVTTEMMTDEAREGPTVESSSCQLQIVETSVPSLEVAEAVSASPSVENSSEEAVSTQESTVKEAEPQAVVPAENSLHDGGKSDVDNVSSKMPAEIPPTEASVPENATQPETAQQKAPQMAVKNVLTKSLIARGKTRGILRGTGPSPSTSKRGAQMLELSRKIHNEPPSKKSKKGELSPKESVQEAKNTFSEMVLTPEGSPARKVAWIPHTYSPCASPSTGILKKRHLVEDPSEEPSGDYSPVSSASKARRVSFADPEVSHSVEIPKPSRMRTRRSLIQTYEDSSRVEKPEAEPAKESPAKSAHKEDDGQNDKASDTVHEKVIETDADSTINKELATFISSAVPEEFAPKQQSIQFQNNSTSQLPNAEDKIAAGDTPTAVPEPVLGDKITSGGTPNQAPEPVREDPVCAEFSDCLDPLSKIIDVLTTSSSKDTVIESLSELGVHTVGQLCALSEPVLIRILSDIPSGRSVKQVLVEYFGLKSSAAVAPCSNDESCATVETIVPPTPAEQSEEMESSDDPVDSCQNGQVIRDSVEVPDLSPADSSNEDKSDHTLSGTIVQEDLLSTVDSQSSGNEAVSQPRTTIDNDTTELSDSAEDFIAKLERHPEKDKIINAMFKRGVITITLNGKVLSL